MGDYRKTSIVTPRLTLIQRVLLLPVAMLWVLLAPLVYSYLFFRRALRG